MENSNALNLTLGARRPLCTVLASTPLLFSPGSEKDSRTFTRFTDVIWGMPLIDRIHAFGHHDQYSKSETTE